MPPGSWSKRRRDRYPGITIGLGNLVYPHELYRFPEKMLALTTRVIPEAKGFAVLVQGTVSANQLRFSQDITDALYLLPPRILGARSRSGPDAQTSTPLAS